MQTEIFRRAGMAVLAMISLAGATACDSNSSTLTGPTNAPTLQSVQVVGPQEYVVGDTGTLKAMATYSDGSQVDVSGQATWTSFNTGVIAVDRGTVTALKEGQCGVTAAFDGRAGQVTVIVTAPPPGGPPGGPGGPGGPGSPALRSLAVSGTTALVRSGPGAPDPTSQLSAIATYSDNSTQDVTAASAWASATGGVASVSGGLVTGHANGSSVISATFQDLTAAVTVSVSTGSAPAPFVSGIAIQGTPCGTIGGSSQLQVIASYSDGTTQNVTAATSWASSTPAVATVAPGGLLSCHAAGSTTITASYQGHTAQLQVVVVPPASTLIGLEVEIDGTLLADGASVGLDLAKLLNGDPILTLKVWGLYSDGSRANVTSLSAITSPSNLIFIDGQGTAEVLALVVQALIMPDHEVHTSYGGLTANVDVDVAIPVLQSLSVGDGSNVTMSNGNSLPSLFTVWSQGVSSNVAAGTPGVNYEFALAPGLLSDLAAVPIIGPTLIGPLTAELNTLVAGLSVVDGTLRVADDVVDELTSILANDLLSALGLTAVPLEMKATAMGVTSSPVQVNLGSGS